MVRLATCRANISRRRPERARDTGAPVAGSNEWQLLQHGHTLYLLYAT